MVEYIEREALIERIDDIWDCADMVFEPNDHCCHDGDCEGCKWAETKNAIRKIIANFPAADVRPVARGKWIQKKNWTRGVCSACSWEIAFVTGNSYNFCPNCGADMRKTEDEKA
jgi:NADH pyrophosphatase NudC (nudix superfamily)